MRLRLVLFLLLTAPPLGAQSFCLDSVPRGPARDIYCVDLIPRPDLRDAAGVVELARVPSAFDVTVTADGHPRQRLIAYVSGLPPVSTLGPYTEYVAWIAPPVLDPVRRLGPVRNGRTVLGETDLDKFVILVSAESSAAVPERRGRLVLRGNSPSTRLQRHDLLMITPEAGADRSHSWPHPPEDSTIPMFMPGIHGLVPEEPPLLPGAGRDPGEIPPARPRQLVTLRSGDTLRLTAGLVRRTIAGRTLTMYGYNGQYPGPLIRVRRDATITVVFVNQLGEPSAVHWHGLRLDNRFDGAVGVTQDAVPPGGQFTYTVRFPDAGIYWYHSHYREDVQQDLGLYGNMLVTGPGWLSGGANREEFLVLDDLLVASDGAFPYGATDPIHALMGRFGNVLLVNGETRYRLAARRGEVVRFYLTNASSTRTFNVSFGGAAMKVVAADAGRFEREAWVESVPIAPAQRYVVDVRFTDTGDVAFLNQVQALNHSYGYFFPQTDTLGMVRVSAAAVVNDHAAAFRPRSNPAVIRELDSYRGHADRPPDRELVLTLRTRDLQFAVERILQLETSYFAPVEWSGTMPMMDWLATGRQARWILRDPTTGRENEAVDWAFRIGEVVKIRLVNDRATLHAMQHPVHLHGQRFLVLAQNGVPNDNLAWKDTVLLPAGSTADILVEMSNPGRWMLHCHIAEHLQAGMMMVFDVR